MHSDFTFLWYIVLGLLCFRTQCIYCTLLEAVSILYSMLIVNVNVHLNNGSVQFCVWDYHVYRLDFTVVQWKTLVFV